MSWEYQPYKTVQAIAGHKTRLNEALTAINTANSTSTPAFSIVKAVDPNRRVLLESMPAVIVFLEGLVDRVRYLSNEEDHLLPLSMECIYPCIDFEHAQIDGSNYALAMKRYLEKALRDNVLGAGVFQADITQFGTLPFDDDDESYVAVLNATVYVRTQQRV